MASPYAHNKDIFFYLEPKIKIFVYVRKVFTVFFAFFNHFAHKKSNSGHGAPNEAAIWIRHGQIRKAVDKSKVIDS